MKAIVLAGGFGTRLRTRVSDVPKPMAPINGRPFLEYLFDLLIQAGISEILISSGYMGEVISEHFGAVYKTAKLTFVTEDTPLGTGGGILNALNHVEIQPEEPVLVLNGDTILKLDYAALLDWYENSDHTIAMVLRNVPDTERYGSVQVQDRHVTGFSEKGRKGPGLIYGGVSILTSAALTQYAPGPAFSVETEFFQKHHAALNIGTFTTDGFFHDIGTPEAFDDAQQLFPLHLQ